MKKKKKKARKIASSQFKRFQDVLESKRDVILKMVTHNEQEAKHSNRIVRVFDGQLVQ